MRDGIQDEFGRDGAVCIRGAFSADEIALVERGIERNLAEPSERALVASRPDDPGRFFEDFCNWDRIPEFEEFIRASPAAAIAGELMGSTQVRLFHDHLLVKEPGTKQKTPGSRTPERATVVVPPTPASVRVQAPSAHR